ncbi:transcription termination factor Rho [Paeniglutamicibacter cryotolerans]|uniref:Transcription termination factor Rho n=1 Tax=Paeniglutamicibacter cryotolerans TaxID=670079 RepID=A0A839QSX7_9MICC|nr:transcription termination factor Rho [Paeniglutamicibacter cryotolerans]MBB2996372.1 transcription termination factor Rho [Paeniglutamicibacter cryotolerans]
MTETTSLTAGVDSNTPPKTTGLAGLKLAQLQALASQLGITGGSRMRKGDLVTAITAHQRGGSVADRAPKAKAVEPVEAAAEKAPAKRANSRAKATEEAPAAAETAPAEEVAEPRATRGRGRSRRAESAQGSNEEAPAPAPAPAVAAAAEEAAEPRATRGRGRSRRAESAQGSNEEASAPAAALEAPAESEEKSSDDSGNEPRNERGNRNRRERGRNRREDRNENEAAAEQAPKAEAVKAESTDSNEAPARGEREGNRRETAEERNNNRRERNRERNERNRDRNAGPERNRERNDRTDRNDRNVDRNNRRGRNRNQPEVDDTELNDSDVLLPVAGILDVLENYAFIRTTGYLAGPNDVYVTLNQVKKYNLRKGDAVVGAIRAPRENENQGQRSKFNALVKLTTINGKPADENTDRVEFGKLVPLYPTERLRLETDPKLVGPRVIDLVAPIGKGQRGLIVSPPKAGKTLILQSIANAITINNPEVHLMMVLVDERPEEVTDMQRTVKGEVIASTFDRPADDHTTVAELAIERAKRLVEMGMDVVVLLDSMTRLGRAYNLAAPASGRILSGGVDSSALYPPKRFFGAARNIENGGSLTILATALVETGSKMDEVIFEEFKGTGNMELRLSRKLADKRIFPAVDVNESGTRREENLLSPDEVKIMWRLRRVLSGLDTQQALELLTNKIRETQSNAEFLMLVNKTTLGSKNDG